MPINTETLNRRLYKVLHQRFKSTTPLDSAGEKTPVEDEADVFKFTFTKDGEEYGTVFATIDDSKKLKIYNGDDVTDSPEAPTPGLGYDDTWFGFLKFLKSWAMQNQLGWDIENKDHLEGDMARRDHMKKKESIAEGYYPMGKKASYSDSVPTVKMIIQHNREIQEGEQRYRNVARIFLENNLGERVLAPTTKPGVAKVYARHIAEGGLPNDERWNHIKGLCEEYNKMAGFVRATRGQQFNESAQQLVESGIQHYNKLRESLSRMTGHRGYNMYFESWTPPLMEDDTDTSSLNELFVQETLDPRIESVMPILSKLHKSVAEMREVGALAEWADSLLEGGDGGEASEETDVDTAGNAGEGGAEDAPDDNLTEAPGAETLAHNDKTVKGNLDAFDLDEGYGDSEDSPVASAITRRILLQRSDLLAKYGPAKVTQAIDEVADFVGDTDEIGSSDVSGWVKQVEQSLASMGTQGVAEESSDNKYSNLSNRGVNRAINRAGDDFNRLLDLDQAESPHYKTQHQQDTKQKLKTKPMAGPKGVLPEQGVAEDLDANQKRVGQLGPTEKVKNNNIGKLVGANENFIAMAPQAVAEGLHPMVIADVEKLATLNPADRYSAYANIRDYFKGDPELSKMASDLQGGYYEADMLRGKYKTDAAKAKYAELEPMHQSFIKRALGQEQAVSEGQEDLDTIKRLLGK